MKRTVKGLARELAERIAAADPEANACLEIVGVMADLFWEDPAGVVGCLMAYGGKRNGAAMIAKQKAEAAAAEAEEDDDVDDEATA